MSEAESFSDVPPSGVLGVGFSPDGDRVVAGGADGLVRVWDASSGERLLEMRHDSPAAVVWGVGFSPDGARVVSGGADGLVRVWDASSGERLLEMRRDPPAGVLGVGFSPDGARVVSGDADGLVRVWDASSGKVLLEMRRDPPAGVLGVGFSPDGDRVVAGGADGLVSVWDASSGKQLLALRPDPWAAVWGVGFSPDGARMVSGDDDGVVRVWDASSGKVLLEMRRDPPAGVLGVGFSPDGAQVVSGDDDGVVRVWDASSGKVLLEMRRDPPAGVLGVGFSPDGARVVSGGADGVVRVWDASSGDQLLQMRHSAGTDPGDIDGSDVEAWGKAAAKTAPTETRQAQPEIPPELPSEERVAFRSDAPCGPDDLGRRQFAEAMADRLRLIQSQSPSDSFLLHLDGAWGAGKTTAMCYLREELQKDSADSDQPSWVAVWLNAWQTQRLSPPWWSLLKALNRREREGLGRTERVGLRFRILRDQLRVAGPAFWVPPLIVLAVLGVLIAWSGLSGVQTAATVIGAVAVVAGLAPAASRMFFIGSARGARRWVQADDNPLEGVVDLFARSIARVGRPVIFLIDDLDRADEGYVREFLDAVQTMVRDAPRLSKATHPSGGPYFVIAADGRWIRIAYERHYETFAAVGQPGKPLGYLFLDKIFQLTATLPRVTSDLQATFLRRQLDMDEAQREAAVAGPPISELQVRIAGATTEQEVREAVDQSESLTPREQLDVRGQAARKVAEPKLAEASHHALEDYQDHLEPNPRSMKLFVNQYGILRQIRLLEGITPPTDALARWTILETRWPALADHLRDHPDDVEWVGAGVDLPEALSGELRPMFTDPAVASAVGEGDARLTPELIVACSGAPL